MKKIIFTSIIISSICANMAFGQFCGSSGPSSCTPANSLPNPGFENPDSIPCAVQGVFYSYSIQFKMFNQFNFIGENTVDSIQFDQVYTGVGNLPCGLCWSTNKA